MSENQTTFRLGPLADPRTAMPQIVRQAYCEGFQDAVNMMRRWGADFGRTEEIKVAISHAAGMIELAKPDVGKSA